MFLFIVCIDSDCEVRIKKEMTMSITMLTELCGDCVDRYRAQRFDELTALLKHILRELDDASKGGKALMRLPSDICGRG